MSAEWRDLGACRALDPDLFYPNRGEPVDLAKAICAECPVSSECLDWALRHERLGIWGGKSERERRVIRRQLGISIETPRVPPSLCGTAGGYRAHLRAGEPTCGPCRAAHVAAQMERRARAS